MDYRVNGSDYITLLNVSLDYTQFRRLTIWEVDENTGC